MKSDKMPNIIYADTESLIRKIDGCAINSENFSTTKIGEHIPRGDLMWTIWAFDPIENKHTLHHGKDFMKKCCEPLTEHTNNIIKVNIRLEIFSIIQVNIEVQQKGFVI